MNLKKVVLQELEKPMKELGYSFRNENSCPGVYEFLKKDKIGFDVGLVLDKSTHSKKIRPDIFVPSHSTINIFYVTDGKYMELSYQDENELRIQLQIVLNQFVTKGDTWINENMIEKFDVYKIFEKHADGFFKEHGFDKVYASENLPVGGRVIYRKGKADIEFTHSDTVLSLGCTIIEDGNMRLLWHIAKDCNVKEPLLGRLKSEEEYMIMINSNLNMLKRCYFKECM